MEKNKIYNVNIDGKVQTKLKLLDKTEDYYIFENVYGDKTVVESWRVCSSYSEDEYTYTCGELADRLNCYAQLKVRIAIDDGNGSFISTPFGAELQLKTSPSGITIEVKNYKDIKTEEY